jgi:hypothetical protein
MYATDFQYIYKIVFSCFQFVFSCFQNVFTCFQNVFRLKTKKTYQKKQRLAIVFSMFFRFQTKSFPILKYKGNTFF